MGGFGIFLLVCSFITGGGAVYSFMTGAEQDYFSFSASLTAGIFLAVLGIGFIIMTQLQEIKQAIESSRKENGEEINNENQAPKWASTFAKIVIIVAIILFVIIIFW